jgi:nicotinate-nucleotide pyrophosphorylase (carboxylating)
MNTTLYMRNVERFKETLTDKALSDFWQDLGSGDVTSKAVLGAPIESQAEIIAKQGGVLAGMLEAEAILHDGGITLHSAMKDGDVLHKGDVIVRIRGPLDEILARERTALNYIQRMSGIATLSRRVAEKWPGRVAYLRKCDPGLLLSEKRAVALGGCLTHRINLSDGIIIKDNHIAAVAAEGIHDPITECIRRAAKSGELVIEIEVESLEDGMIAADALRAVPGEHVIMIDNMAPAELNKVVTALKEKDPKLLIEASGGIKEENVGTYLDAGADVVSSSFLVADAGYLDVSLNVKK